MVIRHLFTFPEGSIIPLDPTQVKTACQNSKLKANGTAQFTKFCFCMFGREDLTIGHNPANLGLMGQIKTPKYGKLKQATGPLC